MAYGVDTTSMLSVSLTSTGSVPARRFTSHLGSPFRRVTLHHSASRPLHHRHPKRRSVTIRSNLECKQCCCRYMNSDGCAKCCGGSRQEGQSRHLRPTPSGVLKKTTRKEGSFNKSGLTPKFSQIYHFLLAD